MRLRSQRITRKFRCRAPALEAPSFQCLWACHGHTRRRGAGRGSPASAGVGGPRGRSPPDQIMTRRAASVAALLIQAVAFAQGTPARQDDAVTLLRPARVFDGETMHEGWAVRVEGERIEAAGPSASVDTSGATIVDMPGATLLPGLVEGHSHVLLHPYNETTWNDQVLHEGLGLRVARATNHLRATLMAGF